MTNHTACKRGRRHAAVSSHASFYADRIVPEDKRLRTAEVGDDSCGNSFLKCFTVFIILQCDDLPESIAGPVRVVDRDLILPQARALIDAGRPVAMSWKFRQPHPISRNCC